MKIFVVTHKKAKMPINNTIYEPIQVGNSSSKFYKFRDNTKDNISNKNGSYCELTAIYWIWKNFNDDYVGVSHYRRYFFTKKNTQNFKYLVDKGYCNNILKNYDIIVPRKLYLLKYNVENQYGSIHNINDLNKCKKIIEKDYPDYISAFNSVMNSHSFYPYNMFICNKKLFDEYCEWLFDILFKLEKKISIQDYDNYNKRIYGFISERLFNVWIIHNNLNIKEEYVNNIETFPIKFNLKNDLKRLILKIRGVI